MLIEMLKNVIEPCIRLHRWRHLYII